MSGDLVGKTLAHFRVLSKLGQGGMGVVYEARDETLHRTVALKVLPDDFAADEDRRRRFLREARSGAAVTHANIAAVHEIGEADGRVYIAMELVEGRTLRDKLAKGPIAVAEAIRIAKAVARGLAKAHEKGIVHRDLKPDNVMVSDDGDVKILDFGVATWVNRAEAKPPVPADIPPLSPKASTLDTQAPLLTEEGRMVGTPAYMSPEQVTGRPVDQRADIFSFGVVLYEMVVGARPFSTKSGNVSVLIATTSETPEPPSKRNAAVTPALERLIERCLAKLPDQRYATAREVARELEAIEQIQSMATMPASSPVISQVTPPPATAGSLPDITATGVGAPPTRPTGYSTLDPASPPTLADAPQPKQRAAVLTRRTVAAIALVAVAAAAGIAGVRLAGRDDQAATPASSLPSPVSTPKPTAITDFPPPTSTSKEAVAAYVTAMQAFRDGNFEAFDTGMRESVRLDPSFAAGHMRVAFAMWHSVRGAITDAREHLQKAGLLRASLSPRDQRLLDALEPAIGREPPDSDAIEARLRAAVDAYPLDAEFLYLLANEQRRYDVDLALATYDRVLAVDPMFMTALRQKAQTQEMHGDVAGARASLDQCVLAMPGATGCRNERIWLDQDEGQCAAIEDDAREMVAADPESYRGYEALARAAVALGRDREAVAEILKQTWARAPREVRARDELLTSARLAALDGRFGDARDLGKRYEAAIAEDTAAATHARAAMLLADVDVETGDARGAAQIAADFLKKQVAWAGAPDLDTGRLLRIEREAGTLSDAQLDAARATFLEGWIRQSSRTRFVRGVAWVVGYGELVEDATDARGALSVLDSYSPVPVGLRTAMNDDALGRAYLFGGNASLAAPKLAHAARMCTAFDEPFRHVRASALLGQALEANGDAAGACAAYAAVLAHWGAARPPSVTAALAKKRSAALGCK